MNNHEDDDAPPKVAVGIQIHNPEQRLLHLTLSEYVLSKLAPIEIDLADDYLVELANRQQNNLSGPTLRLEFGVEGTFSPLSPTVLMISSAALAYLAPVISMVASEVLNGIREAVRTESRSRFTALVRNRSEKEGLLTKEQQHKLLKLCIAHGESLGVEREKATAIAEQIVMCIDLIDASRD